MVNTYCTPTNQVQLRFIASDVDPGSLVEACVDDFLIVGLDTSWTDNCWELAEAVDISAEPGNNIRLQWKDTPGAESYIICRGDIPNFNPVKGEMLGETENTYYSISNIRDNSYFKVIVIR